MDLTSPLRSLVPSLDSAVLEVLAGTESGLSASQITRISARGTRAGQGAVLDRLVRHGLVLAQPANTGHLYQLNRAHVLAPAVMAAVHARHALLDRLRGAVAGLHPAPVTAALFGSLARREGGSDSDIDLLLVLDPDVDRYAPGWQLQIDDLERQALAWSGNRLEVLTLTTDQLTAAVTAEEPLIASLRDDAITVAGSEIGPLLTPASAAGPHGPR